MKKIFYNLFFLLVCISSYNGQNFNFDHKILSDFQKREPLKVTLKKINQKILKAKYNGEKIKELEYLFELIEAEIKIGDLTSAINRIYSTYSLISKKDFKNFAKLNTLYIKCLIYIDGDNMSTNNLASKLINDNFQIICKIKDQDDLACLFVDNLLLKVINKAGKISNISPNTNIIDEIKKMIMTAEVNALKIKDEKKRKTRLGNIFLMKTWLLLYQNKIKESIEMIEYTSDFFSNNDLSFFSQIYRQKAIIESKKNNPDIKIILYYLFNSYRIAKYYGLKREELIDLPMLANAYDNSHDKGRSVHYYKEYFDLKEKLQTEYQSIHLKSSLSNNGINIQKYFIILAIAFLLLIVFYYNRLKNLETKKTLEKHKAIEDKENKVDKPNDVINPQIIYELKEIVKQDFLVYFMKFKEFFPDFNKALLKDYPSLTDNELKFCSLLKLNFTTKEIAIFTKSSVKSIESKKYRLRKKMGLLPESNLYNIIAKYP